MALDLSSNEAIKKLTLQDLINDAVERKDKKALEWLKAQANTDKVRTKSDGTEYTVKKSIVEIRPAYIKEFHNYKTNASKNAELAKQRQREKKLQKMNEMFDNAFAMLDD